MKSLIILVVCIPAMIASCSCPNSVEQEPIIETIVQGDFELTLYSSQSEYLLDALFTTSPIKISAELEYTGVSDKLEISHYSQIGYITLCYADGSPVVSVEVGAESVPAIIRKNEKIVIAQDFSDDWYKQFITEGEYIAKVNVEFVLTNNNEVVAIEAELPIIIK